MLDTIRRRFAKAPDTRYSPPPTPARPSVPIKIAAPLRGFANLPGSDRASLARIGAAVSARLATDATATRLPAIDLDIHVVPDFLSADECTAMIALIDADVVPSTSLRPAGETAVRTSQTCRLSPEHPLVAAVETRICTLLGIDPAHSETIQGQRYTPGQYFKVHNDYFAGGQPYSEVVASEGGQRTWTAMVYLDEPEAGGETVFPHATVRVAPRAGTLLTWNNMNAAGDPSRYAHHEGAPVTAGVKHVLTKWFRERHWEGSERSDALRAAR